MTKRIFTMTSSRRRLFCMGMIALMLASSFVTSMFQLHKYYSFSDYLRGHGGEQFTSTQGHVNDALNMLNDLAQALLDPSTVVERRRKDNGEEEDEEDEGEDEYYPCRHMALEIASVKGSRMEMNRIRRQTILKSRPYQQYQQQQRQQQQQQHPNDQKHPHNQKLHKKHHHKTKTNQNNNTSFDSLSSALVVDEDCLNLLFPLFEQAFLEHHGLVNNDNNGDNNNDDNSDNNNGDKSVPRRRRRLRKHTILHIPKTGGTSVCNYVKDQHHNHSGDWRVPEGPAYDENCQPQAYSPYWCCWDQFPHRLHPLRLSCAQQRIMQGPFDLYMNENWLDSYCPQQQTYSMLLREPISRAMSHDNHLTQFGSDQRHNKAWRRTLVRSNYMTWSLTVNRFLVDDPTLYNSNYTRIYTEPTSAVEGMEIPTPAAYLFRPTNVTHLKEALHRLSLMDFLLDLQYLPESCLHNMFHIMGLTTTKTSSTTSSSSQQHQSSSSSEATTEITGHHNDDSNSTTKPSLLLLPHANTAKNPEYLSKYNHSDFVQWNQLDIALYKQAQQWMNADCYFFERILRRANVDDNDQEEDSEDVATEEVTE